MKPVFAALVLTLSVSITPQTSAQAPEEGRRPAQDQQRPDFRRLDDPAQQGRRPESPPEDGRRPEEGRRPGMLMPPGGAGPGGFMGRFPNPLLNVLDKNRDGELSEEEIDLAVASLKTLDRNRDRRLDASELRSGFPGQGPLGAPRNFSGPETPANPSPAGNPEVMLERMNRMDRNSDNKLSRDELPESMQPMIERFDRDTDGALNQEELRSMVRDRFANSGAPAQAATEMLRRADANGDGRLSSEELPPFLRDRFESLDKNSDGALDSAELQTAMSGQRPMPVPRGAPESGTIRPRRPEGRGPADRPGREGGRPGRPEAESPERSDEPGRDRDRGRPQGDAAESNLKGDDATKDDVKNDVKNNDVKEDGETVGTDQPAEPESE